MNRDLPENARWLVEAIARALQPRHGTGVAEVLARLADQDVSDGAFRAPEPAGLPVLAHLPQSIGETLLLDADVAAAIAAVEEELCWRQSSSYSDALLGEGFTRNYGWAEIIGPHGFFAGDDFLLGLLMLGPNRHYRDHFHPAPELYWPLTSGSQWSIDGGDFAEVPQGATIWHPPMALHATKTSETPLLAVWCWTRDTGTPAKLAGP
ncbi:dimethylsulfonioproprionate lyase family protein [Aestuariivirga sp.]|uniref:dimethylsulfonioproprionate lyase family protein n=1 Tax=Aestuariivirga sp. TaxID=2650926 RepID=UPI003BAA39E8